MAAAERRLAIPQIIPHEWRWPSPANLKELVSNLRGKQMITLDSLRTGESRSKHQKEAKKAYQTLDTLIEQAAIIPLDNDREIRLLKEPMTRRGYEGIVAIRAVINQKEGQESSQIGYCCLAEQGAAYFFFPGSIFIEDRLMEDVSTDGYLSYASRFTPEASKPLVDWLVKMKQRGKYIPPPQFSLPPHTPFSPS